MSFLITSPSGHTTRIEGVRNDIDDHLGLPGAWRAVDNDTLVPAGCPHRALLGCVRVGHQIAVALLGRDEHAHLLLDELGDKGLLEPAQQGGGDEVSDGEHEDHQHPGADPGVGEGQEHPSEGLDRCPPEVPGGGHEVRIDALHHAVERKDHEREQDVDHPDDDAGEVVDERERLADETEAQQERADDPALLEEHDPGVEADEQADPEGEDNEDHQKARDPGAHGGEQVRHRVAEQEADHGHVEADPEGVEDHPQVDRLGDRADVVGGREAAVLGVERAPERDLPEREGEEDGQERQRRQHQRDHPEAPAGARPEPARAPAIARGGGQASFHASPRLIRASSFLSHHAWLKGAWRSRFSGLVGRSGAFFLSIRAMALRLVGP